MGPSKFGSGQAVRRKEDDPLLRGNGRYVSDDMPDGVTHAVVLRSPHAHARFRLDVAKARAMPSVGLILTAQDLVGLGPLPCQAAPPDTTIVAPPYDVLARDEVRHVGDAVAFVVADTLDQAKDAAEAIEISWSPLSHVVGVESALGRDAPLVWPDRPGNVVFELALGDRAAISQAFATAAHTVSLTVVNQRLVSNFLETRGVVAEYDGAKDLTTLRLSSQGSHFVRDVLCENILHIARDRMRVITPDVGGAFGTKLFPYREYALAAVAAQRLGRPVRWTADRTEHFLGDTHGRDNVTKASLALDLKGRFLALDIDLMADMGAYLSCFAPFITVPVDAYRGAGRPEASYAIERLVDAAARDLGLAPDVLRRRNFIKRRAMPYTTATGKTYDSADFAAHMARAQEIADWNGFKKRAAQSKKQGKLRGIGLSTYVEACGSNGPETATVRLDTDGVVAVLIGSQASGQGHQTAYAQIVADHLNLPPAHVRVVQGDTALIASGAGTGGSSSIPVGGAALDAATRKLADNLKTLAAEALEASASDLEFGESLVRVAGTDRMISFADLARRPEATPERLAAMEEFAATEATYPNGTHLAEVEIDPATGRVELLNYVIVDDFGVTLNPLLLEGQVHGGVVQGIGQAMMEGAVYDRDSGQLVTATLMDYALPRAEDTPGFVFETKNVACKSNPLGVKGAGEAGAIGSCPAVMNAVLDALWRTYRIRHLDMPATAQRVWAAIEERRRLHTL
jgi:carbon-monoxide dehydrogenase large subunit